MDEPLSNLDAKLRVAMRAELARLHERLATTTVYVTHDQIEAMTLGQRVTVMRNGVVQQVGPPQQLYRDPNNLFVAAFIGSPSMNLVEATATTATSSSRASAFRSHRTAVRCARVRVILGIRPDDFEAVEHADPRCRRSTSRWRSWRSSARRTT